MYICIQQARWKMEQKPSDADDISKLRSSNFNYLYII